MIKIGTNKKFILHVSNGFGGGMGTVIKNLITYQLSQGYKVGVLYPERENEYDEMFFNEFKGKIVKIPVRKRKKFTQIFGLPIKKEYTKIKKNNPNYRIILHAHNPVVIGLIYNIKNLPLICTIHAVNTERSYMSKVITNIILKRLKRNKCFIVGVSEYISKYYNKILRSEFTRTILNGVAINPTETMFEFSKYTIGYLAYMNDLKGWVYLFNAYNLLSSHYKERIDLIFVGQADQVEKDRIDLLIDKNNLTGKVKYLGLIENAGNKITPVVDLVVLPSKTEGLPMTLIEAQGNRVPILATKVGGIPEILNDGQNGFFIKRNSEDIADKIKKLYDNQGLYKKMQQNSIQTYNDKFTIDKMGKNYLELYNKI